VTANKGHQPASRLRIVEGSASKGQEIEGQGKDVVIAFGVEEARGLEVEAESGEEVAGELKAQEFLDIRHLNLLKSFEFKILAHFSWKAR
jgi:hypothetical protein